MRLRQDARRAGLVLAVVGVVLLATGLGARADSPAITGFTPAKGAAGTTVIIGGFGFTGTMEKLGIERRAYTAGTNKDFLDPFAPEKPEHREHAKKMLDEIHQQFINTVKQGRGKRLKESPEIFSGLVWTGEKSIELGLADALGSAEYVAREVVKAERLVDFTPEENVFELVSKRLGTSFGAGFAHAFWQAASSVQVR